jgi:hypothetical protein
LVYIRKPMRRTAAEHFRDDGAHDLFCGEHLWWCHD